MRHIRFNAWLVKQKEMVEVSSKGMFMIDGTEFGIIPQPEPSNIAQELCSAGRGGMCSDYFGEDLILLQDTGFKDKKGSKIYDGWITSDDSGMRPVKMFVFWDDDLGEWRLRSTTSTYTKKLTKEEAQYHEVIGNIYENTEL